MVYPAVGGLSGSFGRAKVGDHPYWAVHRPPLGLGPTKVRDVSKSCCCNAICHSPHMERHLTREKGRGKLVTRSRVMLAERCTKWLRRS